MPRGVSAVLDRLEILMLNNGWGAHAFDYCCLLLKMPPGVSAVLD